MNGIQIEPSVLSVLPPLVAIGLAVWKRQVYVALAVGIWLGWMPAIALSPMAWLAARRHA